MAGVDDVELFLQARAFKGDLGLRFGKILHAIMKFQSLAELQCNLYVLPLHGVLRAKNGERYQMVKLDRYSVIGHSPELIPVNIPRCIHSEEIRRRRLRRWAQYQTREGLHQLLSIRLVYARRIQ